MTTSKKQFEMITLKNGLRIILIPRADQVATTVLVLVAAGSKYEKKPINGISHFLEHLCFKGTTRRPKSIDISIELDRIGARHNAFTSQEYTGYWAKAQAHQSEKILDIVSDLYLHPTFPAAEIEKEKGVIIEELNMYEDLPNRKVHDVFHELLYGDQPAGWDVGGTKEVIRRLTRQEIVDYRAAHYVASSTLVVIAGGFSKAKLLPLIKKNFEPIPIGTAQGKAPVREAQVKPMVKVHYKKSDQTHIVLGVRAFNMYDERQYALELLGDILGGSMASRLFQKLREELGSAYYVRAGSDLMTDHGYFAVGAGIGHEKLEESLRAILAEMRDLARGGITDEEVSRAKEHLAGSTLISLETSDDLANFYGAQEILKQPVMTPEQVIAKINAVSKDEVTAVARTIFKNEGLNLAAVGPYRDGLAFEKLLKI